MNSDYGALEEMLRQNLKLRHDLGIEVAKSRHDSGNRRGERPDEVPQTPPVQDDLEEFRRKLRAEVTKISANHGSGELLSPVGAAETVSDNDDLGELRRQLKLRLGAEPTTTEDTSQKHGGAVAYRFGQSLYWACLMLGLTWIGPCLFAATTSSAEQNQLITPATLAVILVPPLLLHGIGRDLRFLLCGK